LAILDDVCASQHGQKAGADQNLKGKLADNQRQNKYFEDWGMGKVTRISKTDAQNLLLTKVRSRTISIRFFANYKYIYIFHKTEVQAVNLRC
jgi:hypothetical protein